MRLAAVAGPRSVAITETAQLVPEPEQVVVDVTACGICGTDVHAYVSGEPISQAVFGHEWTGVVRAAGRDAAVEEGSRVVVAVGPPCGRCAYCTSGSAGYCQVTFEEELGTDPRAPDHGGFAEELTVDHRRVMVIPGRMSTIQAALVEPATVAHRAVRRSALRVGDRVVILGGGPIGQLVLQWARLDGAAEVILFDPIEARRNLASRFGATAMAPGEEADQAVLDRTEGRGADVVFECTGVEALVQQSVNLVRRGGSCALVGFPDGISEVGIAAWLIKEVTVTTSLGYAHDDFVRTVDALADGRIDVTPLYTRSVPLDDLGATLETLSAGSGTDVKVLVEP